MRGAEALVRKTRKGYVKERLPKGYRHPEIDRALRLSRTKAEARLIERARKAGVSVPSVGVLGESTLLLGAVPGKLVKEVLDRRPALARRIGEHVARLHDAGIIHGDLTTSNMVLSGREVYLIDFGLGFSSQRTEDKAVDLHVFLQATESLHHRTAKRIWSAFLKGYRPGDREEVLARLEKVRARGRNK